MEDIAVDGIRIGRAYARYGLKVAATWVEYAGKVLGDVGELLRDQSDVIGPKASAPSSDPADPQ